MSFELVEGKSRISLWLTSPWLHSSRGHHKQLSRGRTDTGWIFSENSSNWYSGNQEDQATSMAYNILLQKHPAREREEDKRRQLFSSLHLSPTLRARRGTCTENPGSHWVI